MTNYRPISFACAIIATELPQRSLLGLLFSKRENIDHHSRIKATLSAFGLKVAGQHQEPIQMFSDFEEEFQLTRVPVSEQIELWLGWPVAYMMQDLHQLSLGSTNMPPKKLDALFITQDDVNHRYAHQYVSGGKFGDGCISCDYSKRSWHRVYSQGQWPAPLSKFLKIATRQLQTKIGADEALVERVYSGMYGKGRYGMAYHPSKKTWVMARSLPDQLGDPPSAGCQMYQELNQNSYAKKGQPFQALIAPSSGCKFFRQADVIRELQQLAIVASLGFRFDQPILDQSLFAGEFDKYWVERSASADP